MAAFTGLLLFDQQGSCLLRAGISGHLLHVDPFNVQSDGNTFKCNRKCILILYTGVYTDLRTCKISGGVWKADPMP